MRPAHYVIFVLDPIEGTRAPILMTWTPQSAASRETFNESGLIPHHG